MEVQSGFCFLHPCTISICGNSASGKTTLTLEILKNVTQLFIPKPKHLIVLYSQYQPLYEEFKSLNFESISLIQGLNLDFESIQDCIVVIDDMMTDIMKSSKVQEVFTKISHHREVSIISLTQNLFPSGRYSKDIRLNLHYYIVLKSFTLQSQVKHLGLQVFPENKNFLTDAYKKATVKHFSYLVVILHPQWKDDITRVVTNIFPSEDLVVYVPKK